MNIIKLILIIPLLIIVFLITIVSLVPAFTCLAIGSVLNKLPLLLIGELLGQPEVISNDTQI